MDRIFLPHCQQQKDKPTEHVHVASKMKVNEKKVLM